MNTSLGIDFFRTVGEQGSNGWAQVYARVPFDESELLEKGALFGAIFGTPDEDWASIEAKYIEWVDEYFNKIEKGGDLGLFFECLKRKFPEILGSWLWILPNKDGTREIKTVRSGLSGVSLLREGREFPLSVEEGKVIRGPVNAGDKVIIWSGKLGDLLGEDEKKTADEETAHNLGEKLVGITESGAGLFINIEKFVGVEESSLNEVEKPEEVVVEDKETIEGGETAVVEEKSDDLAGERLIGPVKLKDRLKNWWKKTIVSKRQDLRVDSEGSTKRKKWALFTGVLFLLLLAISLILGSVKLKADREAKKWAEFSEPIIKNIQEATDLVKINPSGARKLVSDIKQVFDIQKAEFVGGKYADELADLEQKLNEAWTVTSGEKESVVLDLANIGLVRSGFVGERMSLIESGEVLVLDSKLGTVVSVVTASKDIKVVAGKGEGLEWIDAVSNGSKAYVLSTKGVSVDGKETGGIVFDMAVGKPLAIGRFGSSLYVLDGSNKEIYKYGAIGSGFGDRTRWLVQDQSISLDPVDMAIDSDVWILGGSGSVERFRRGARESFTLNGVPEGVVTSKIAVQAEGNSLAMLDKVNGVVILCSKETGSCEQQLKSEKLKMASDIEFDGDSLLVLVGEMIGVLK